jgi:hypothetical protein
MNRLMELWLEGFGGLVCPFPRLEAMRSRPELIADWAEYTELVIKEAEYLKNRYNKQQEYYDYIKEIKG